MVKPGRVIRGMPSRGGSSMEKTAGSGRFAEKLADEFMRLFKGRFSTVSRRTIP